MAPTSVAETGCIARWRRVAQRGEGGATSVSPGLPVSVDVKRMFKRRGTTGTTGKSCDLLFLVNDSGQVIERRRVAGSRNIDTCGHKDRGEYITATLLGKV